MADDLTTAEPVHVQTTQVNQDDVDYVFQQAQEVMTAAGSDRLELPPGMRPFQFQNLAGSTTVPAAASFEGTGDVDLELKFELARTHMRLEDVLRLRSGAIVTLDRLAGDPVDILVNGRLIARGEVLVMNENFCIRVTELIVDECACA